MRSRMVVMNLDIFQKDTARIGIGVEKILIHPLPFGGGEQGMSGPVVTDRSTMAPWRSCHSLFVEFVLIIVS